MPNRNYARGAQKERELCRLKRAKGYFTMRAAGSHGVDVLIAKPGDFRVYEVKSGPSPYSDFGPAARQELRRSAERAGAAAWLAWFPTGRNTPEEYPSLEWPQ